MGIIVNDGLHRPTIDIRRVGFGMGTPYHTVLEQTPRAGEQVMRTPIARALPAVLAAVGADAWIVSSSVRPTGCSPSLGDGAKIKALYLQ
jgi:hypothetical protein